MKSSFIYLDHAATTPVDPEVLEKMIPWFSEAFANASNTDNRAGLDAKSAVEEARESISSLIESSSKELIFTSGATESNNLAIKGVFDAYIQKGNHVITCATAHSAILEPVRSLKARGAAISVLSVDKNGHIDLQELENIITEKTILVSLLWGNNETGVIQYIKEISNIVRSKNVLLHLDATQAIGKIPISVKYADLLSGSAHKFYGPKGVGFLYIRRNNPRVFIHSLFNGGSQERGFRAGTLNVPGIVGMGEAAKLAKQRMDLDRKNILSLRTDLILKLKTIYPSLKIHGSGNMLPHILNLFIPGLALEKLISETAEELVFSRGAACNTASIQPSHVLMAMSLDRAEADLSFRISFGRSNTLEEMERVIELFS